MPPVNYYGQKNGLPRIPPPGEIVDAALQRIRDVLSSGKWPSDEWFTLSQQYDLNIYMNDADGEKHAVIYPVSKDGQTWTSGAYYRVPIVERTETSMVISPEVETSVVYFDRVSDKWIQKTFWSPETNFIVNDGILTVSVNGIPRLILAPGEWSKLEYYVEER